MQPTTTLLGIIPVLPSSDIVRDTARYKEKTGFHTIFSDKMYAVLHRDDLSIHPQWHAKIEDDPLPGGPVIRIFVKNINPLFDEFVEGGTVNKNKFVANTPWQTNEFGFYNLNNNAIFIVEDITG